MTVFGRVPFDSLDMPGIFLGFLGRDPGLSGALPEMPPGARELWDRSAGRRAFEKPEAWRARMAGALRAYARKHEAGPAVFEACERFARPGTLAVVAGQQPGLFGGPLYLWHKVATALRLAVELRELPEAPEVVTLFWNHSEDHDWGEANHAFLVNPNLDLQRVRLSLPSTGHPLHEVEVGALLAKALEEARDLLPLLGEREEEMGLLAPRGPGDTLGDHLARILFHHFGEKGLLILEPGDLDPCLREPLRDWQGRAEDLRSVFRADLAELQSRGYDVTVDPEGPLFFLLGRGEKRAALPDGEGCPEGRLLSPGVMLRPVWQDLILPTLAYVIGPGEASYLALAGGLYRACGVERPLLVPRISATHVSSKLREDLDRWEIRLPDLDQGPGPLEERISGLEGGGEGGLREEDLPEERLRGLGASLVQDLKALEGGVAQVDPNLVLPMARLGSRASSGLRKLAAKVARQRLNQAGAFKQHARRLCAELRPRGRFQEGVLPALPFLVRAGRGFTEGLIRVSDPFCREHLLVTLPGGG